MQGYLTTHVLDTARGCPAAGLKIELIRHVPESGPIALQTTITNADGRTDGPILPQDAFKLGSYELIFHAGAYLRAQIIITCRYCCLLTGIQPIAAASKICGE